MSEHQHEPPQWMKDYVDTCIEAFGLGEWDIRISMHRIVDEENDRLAQALLQAEYEDADLHFRDNLQPDREGYTAVTHEVLHLAGAPQDLAVDRIIDLVPEKLKEHARQLWTDADELGTTRLARALARQLAPGLKTKKP